MSGVLVTAASTPLGVALLEALLAREDLGAVLAVGAEPDPPLLSGAPNQERLRYERVDLTRPRSVQQLLFGPARALGVHTLIHTALHRSARDGGERVHALNVESTRELLYQAERHSSLRRLVFRSYGDVYRVDPRRPQLIAEDHPLEMSADAPARVRQRVEADVTVCTRMGLSRLKIAVLRCAEIFADNLGSQLVDYLSSRICMRPLGFDPMLNLLTLEDAVCAQLSATDSDEQGVFNIPGADTLPLSLAIRRAGRVGVAVPGPLLAPLYSLRATTLGMEFRYDMNHRRFHFSAVLDGRRAHAALGYQPQHPIRWPA